MIPPEWLSVKNTREAWELPWPVLHVNEVSRIHKKRKEGKHKPEMGVCYIYLYGL